MREIRTLIGPMAAVFLAVACSGDSTSPGPAVVAHLTLAPGAFAVLGDSAVGGKLEFPAAGASGAEYLVVGQLASPNEVTSSFTLGAASLVAAPAPPPSSAPLALRFHDMLRTREAGMAALAPLYRPLFRTAPQAAPPTVGTKRTFKVCGNIACSSTVNVPATAQYVGAHAAIFVDDTVPANGFSASDISQVGAQFDQVLYPIDHARFGAESDIDGNGVVIVLLTEQINKLAPQPGCNTSFITGFFFGADIAPGIASQYNNGEIFYGMVPDPSGSVACTYSTTFVKNIIPVTFIHEFQHMISFNQHVLLRSGSQEVLWLNEGMSHLAEELGGLHYDSAAMTSTASFFYAGDLTNAYQWLQSPQANAMVSETPPGSLPERGAEWLFLRYLMDQFGPSLSSTLEQTNLTGAANVEAGTGTLFGTLLGRWALALYLGDLPGFTAPSQLKYTTWSFRNTYASLHAQDATHFPVAFPLQPDSGAGPQVSASGSLAAGSGAFLISTQAANATAFDLGFKGVPAADKPQIAVARIH